MKLLGWFWSLRQRIGAWRYHRELERRRRRLAVPLSAGRRLLPSRPLLPKICPGCSRPFGDEVALGEHMHTCPAWEQNKQTTRQIVRGEW